jgi:hypothetical protein
MGLKDRAGRRLSWAAQASLAYAGGFQGRIAIFLIFLDKNPILGHTDFYRWRTARLNAPDRQRPPPPRIGEQTG